VCVDRSEAVGDGVVGVDDQTREARLDAEAGAETVRYR
jgi:hypothetical protein